MKTRLWLSACAIAALALAGCDVERESPPDVEETVFDEQVQALDKARAVEGLNEERLQKLRDAEDGKNGKNGKKGNDSGAGG